MIRKNIYRRSIYGILLVVLLLIVTANFSGNFIYVNKIYLYGQYDKYLDSIAGKLIFEKFIPAGISEKELKMNSLIYVLGGTQDSLKNRFRKAAFLYHNGYSKKILILSRPGITEFSLELGRNLTNDEWAIRELGKSNVRKEDIDPVTVQNNGFGTLSEAKELLGIVRKKGCNRLILVTSDYHTRRVFNTFSSCVADNSINIYIYGSEDVKSTKNILLEYVKLFIYDHFVISRYG